MQSLDLYDQLASAKGTGELAAALATAPAVILYGAGNIGHDALRVLRDRGIAVRCFLDRNARPGLEREGVPVLLPDDPALGPELRETAPVVVSLFNPDVDASAVHADLRRLGWKNVIPFGRFHAEFAAGLGSRYWLTDLSFYADRAPRLRAAAGLWADERSRAIYDAVLRYRWRGEFDPLLTPDAGAQYFPEDAPPWPTPARFVDCGAYDGDTLEQIRARRFALDAVAAFEPDPASLPKLAAVLRELGAETLLWPCAVSGSTTRLRFAAGLGTASNLCADGAEVVQAVALDDALSGFRPTLLKLDIEGAEHDALLGARELIRRHRPGLAVCVYHRPEHLWEIPLLIQNWNLGYRFWLRVHGHNGFEIVLYAQAET